MAGALISPTGNYQRLLDVEKLDLVVGGHGNNSMTSAMPLAMKRGRY